MRAWCQRTIQESLGTVPHVNEADWIVSGETQKNVRSGMNRAIIVPRSWRCWQSATEDWSTEKGWIH